MKKLPGFSLIEIAMVLLIFGVIASLTLPLLTTSQTLQRQKTTEVNKESLFAALASYVLLHDRLPKPSLPSLEGKSHNHLTIGIIPYQELGISEAMARDGYGNWFTYTVNAKLSDTKLQTVHHSNGTGYCVQEKGIGGIQLNFLSGESVFNEKESKGKDFIALILISHGPKGTGAFQATQDERRSVTHPKETINSNAESLFHVKGSTENDPDFNHQVYWMTRNNLMALYAKKPCVSVFQPSTPDPVNIADSVQNDVYYHELGNQP